mmetsp:Transcript_21394/g.44627  ORF Transcript_21394/g.44627 Transcript_21394/m.44627 type:complete len:416 (-) Transcript_21394:303-1550(-)|eukprot:CAMPEP_0172465828 /NCGR_PEP_ID=MMETSP1065-20121228/54627_1 /TAXON_ID=265537 /ORGANISM="Amphiprora paludosa, Strain CCMP125" /LENGTH=415 /DNA_ID=CAMNT_0013222473 /DNA_START=185 /DNA_END=1432 /DNA_ORIENTATION=-
MKLSVLLLPLLAAKQASAFLPASNGSPKKSLRPLFLSEPNSPDAMQKLAMEWASRNKDTDSSTATTAAVAPAPPAAAPAPPPAMATPPAPAPASPPPTPSPIIVPPPAPKLSDLAAEWASRNQDTASPAPARMPPLQPAATSLPQPEPAVAVKEMSPPPIIPIAPPPGALATIPTKASNQLDQISEALDVMNNDLEVTPAKLNVALNDENSAKLDEIGKVLGNLNTLVAEQSSSAIAAQALADIDQRLVGINQQLADITNLLSQQNDALQSQSQSISDQTGAIQESTKHGRLQNAFSMVDRDAFEYHFYELETGAPMFQQSPLLLEEILTNFWRGEGYCLPHEAVLQSTYNKRFLPNSRENWKQEWDSDYEDALQQATAEFRTQVVDQLTTILGTKPIIKEENGWYCVYYDGEAI